MSHQGTNWAILQRGLKPTTRIVLWHLCDRYNPDYGCFPAQERLAFDCEISRSTLNLHLIRLESAKLLRRVQRIDPISKQQMSTQYILGFEDGFPSMLEDCERETTPFEDPITEKPCPEIGHGDANKEHHKNNDLNDRLQNCLCPVLSQSRVRKTANPVS
jgi:hypothetical protein